MSDFIKQFALDDGYTSVCIGSPQNAVYIQADELRSSELVFPLDKDVYYGPASRKVTGDQKEHVLGTKTLWVDYDETQKPQCTLPPSAMVFSGHGWHLYWYLKEPLLDIDKIESLNKILTEDVPGADEATWNCNRVLRVPGTKNCKNPNMIVEVELRQHSGLAYSLDDISNLQRLPKNTKHKIRTGDSRGYRSRSERDWSIIVDLVRAGYDDDTIKLIFMKQPCGDKYRDSEGTPYLEHTLERAREVHVARGGGKKAPRDNTRTVEERDDGIYMLSARGMRKVSTFTITPKILLQAYDESSEDAIVGDVHAGGYVWEDQTFPKSAFTSSSRLDKSLPLAAWQWTGRDDDVRLLLPHLMERLLDKGLPKVMATSVLGLHFIKGRPYYVGDSHVLSSTETWRAYDGPISWLPTRREHPKLDLEGQVDEAMLQILREEVPMLNDPQSIWPMIGWYSASIIKPWIELKGYRFPILNVTGTRGSGKTTLIQRVFLPMIGQLDPKPYDAGTTRFVTLAIMGSSNAVPVAFAEFRYSSAEQFLRFILLSYDTGHDPRGRGDQTTVDYPLSAPFSVDGEDMIQDPAAMQRIIVAQLHPDSIAEGTEAQKTFKLFRRKRWNGFAPYFIQRTLAKIEDGSLSTLLDQAEQEMYSTYEGRMPERIRANHTVAYMGVCLWCDAVGADRPSPRVLEGSISAVFDLKSGRSRTLADSLVEDVVNACSAGVNSFRWTGVTSGDVVYFQLASAHSWWLASRRRQGKGGLERDAVRAQLKESPYVVGPVVIKDALMYGIDLQKAVDYGLDIPVVVRMHEFTMKF